ncbi:hypothetical protein GCM10009844_01940 [Nocardioides koreensis]|uniref:Uncharacterized protein n=1 Tax=Nocardioides koreensis TaxID=433651 RepID=A0ABP5KQR1_9ACTN
MDADLIRYEQYGKGHTLPTFWALCDACETIYQAGEDVVAVGVTRSSGAWSWVADADVAECIGRPLSVFRRTDKAVDPWWD